MKHYHELTYGEKVRERQDGPAFYCLITLTYYRDCVSGWAQHRRDVDALMQMRATG